MKPTTPKLLKLAERVGFEPTVEVSPYTRLVQSVAIALLAIIRDINEIRETSFGKPDTYLGFLVLSRRVKLLFGILYNH